MAKKTKQQKAEWDERKWKRTYIHHSSFELTIDMDEERRIDRCVMMTG